MVFGQLQQQAGPLAGLNAGDLAIPLVDVGALAFEFAELQQLGSERALADAVGIGFAFGAGDGGLGVAIGLGDLG